jgi:hypothetical protein
MNTLCLRVEMQRTKRYGLLFVCYKVSDQVLPPSSNSFWGAVSEFVASWAEGREVCPACPKLTKFLCGLCGRCDKCCWHLERRGA